MKKYKVIFTKDGSRGDVGSYKVGDTKSLEYLIACRVVGGKVAKAVGWEFDFSTGREKEKVKQPKEHNKNVQVNKEKTKEVADNARE